MGAWWAAVSGVAQSRTQLKWLSSSSSLCAWKSLASCLPSFPPSKTLLLFSLSTCFLLRLPQPPSHTSVVYTAFATLLWFVKFFFSSGPDPRDLRLLCIFVFMFSMPHIQNYEREIRWVKEWKNKWKTKSWKSTNIEIQCIPNGWECGDICRTQFNHFMLQVK